MKLVHGFDSPEDWRGGYVAIGNFDGVHRGHQFMVERLRQHAGRAGVPAVVLTFDPHPIRILRPDQTPPSLNTIHRKAELLCAHGVDCVIAYPTNPELLALEPRVFFDRIVIEQLRACGLVEGPNFCFGRNRAGTVDLLRTFCDDARLSLEVVDPVRFDGSMVSSSIVRSLISSGNLNEAIKLLGHPYRIEGVVASGAGRGRNIGFATANLSSVETLVPSDGVYAGRCRIDDRDITAAVHIGSNPTFDEPERKIEVHVIGFSGDLYQRSLQVDLLARVRDTQWFANPDALQQQIQRDVAEIRTIAAR